MTGPVVVYGLAAVIVWPLAFLYLAALEEEPPTLLDGLGLMMASLLVGVLWPLAGVLGLLAVLGRTLARGIWFQRHPADLDEPLT